MRLPYVSPQNLTAVQRPLHDDMKAGATAKYQTFETVRADGALMGPWSAWLHEPELGTAIWGLSKAMTRFKHLPELVRQVAILVVGARFRAAYEIYAHSVVGRSAGILEPELTAILSGIRPVGLSHEAETAYDVATALLAGGVLDTALYAQSLELFGQLGTSELICLVGYYCFVSMTLNGFDVPVPGATEAD
jgi:4-carboxymuconolactone decarboxylase